MRLCVQNAHELLAGNRFFLVQILRNLVQFALVVAQKLVGFAVLGLHDLHDFGIDFGCGLFAAGKACVAAEVGVVHGLQGDHVEVLGHAVAGDEGAGQLGGLLDIIGCTGGDGVENDWEGIIGNCDTLLYLGGNEYGTYEYLSKILGKETERTKSQSIGKGSRGSSSDSLQTAGRELCMPDEIRRMRDDECLLLMRSEDPVIDKKYNLLHHPNVKYTPDAGGEPYVMPPDYMGDAVTITMGAVAAATAPEITEEMYEQLDYLEKHPEENYYENEENFSQYDQGD